MRICMVYDCLFPWTVGGAERWTRNVAEALAGEPLLTVVADSAGAEVLDAARRLGDLCQLEAAQ
jgi:hypothetical protein